MKIRSFLLYHILLAMFLLPLDLWGQGIIPQTTREVPLQVLPDTVPLRPFPPTRITDAFTSSGNLISQSEKMHFTDEDVAEFTQEVDTLLFEIRNFLDNSEISTLEGITIRDLDQISGRSKLFIVKIDGLQDKLSQMAQDFEDQSELLFQFQKRWQLTRESIGLNDQVETRSLRIEQTIQKLDSVNSLLKSDLALVLEGQDQLADREMKLNEIADQTQAQKVAFGETLFIVDSPGFFKDLSKLKDPLLISSHVKKFKSTVKNDYDILKSTFRKPLIVAALFLLGFLIFFTWFKRHHAHLINEKKYKLSKIHKSIINSPVVVSLFVVTLMVRFLLFDLPQTFFYLNALILMVPMIILSIRFFGPVIRTWIIVLLVIFSSTLIYELSYTPGPVLRIILMGVCFTGLWLFIWLYRKRPFTGDVKNRFIYDLFRWLIMGFTGLLFIAIIANLVGSVRLAEYLALLPLQIVVVGIWIQVSSKLADTLVYLLIASKQLQKLNVVKDYSKILHQKIMWGINLFLWLFFLVTMLRIFLLKDAIFSWGRELLTGGKKLGNIDFTLGNIFIFFFVIWLSVMITRILSAILDKDVFTRVKTAKGIPSTILLLLRITFITGGFFLAAGAAGMELSNLSIVLGAFSVGIGFGLQNIFNNMVSGLILAFERPIKVGDVVQVDQLMGTVKTIGLRSSTVRSFDGAEVIVPNGNLISNQMINWTLSDSSRRMDIRFGVAYGTNPEVVLNMLKEIASEHPSVQKDPEPVSHFLEFGDSSLNFRLMAWVSLDLRQQTESELKVVINRRLAEAGIEIPFPQRDLHIRSDATKPLPTGKE